MSEFQASLLEVALPEDSTDANFGQRQVTTGEMLASARDRAGLNAAGVAARLRLSTDQIEALDAERWEHLPDRAFVRAALRSYGRLVGVDVTPLVEHVGGYARASALQPVQAAPGQSARARRSAIKPARANASRPRTGNPFSRASWPIRVGAIAGVALVSLVVLLLVQPGPVAESSTVQVVPIPGVPSPAVPASTIEKNIDANGQLTMTQVATMPMTLQASGMLTRAVINEAPAQPVIVEKPARAVRQAAPQPVGITVFPVQMPETEPVYVHFKKRSWVDISHKDGVKLLAGTQDGGQSFTLDARPPMEVKIGNPAGVMIEFREQVVDLQSKINQKGIAQFTLN